ncbi:hypothetical protein EV182_005242 [Spiromyces aspiralis]|uniref:Uncharacterized protein n=1 Tax=Spiromyces aspiralis TaxID=68401 RepID=A0ACC1HNU8_9FUNG|nr:hypothetical protein EV182_005242 [Spiromyces aspiralis]
MVNSTVSSRMLESIAKAEGFKYADTLTGFKWMANKLVDLKKEGYYIGFGYEEAIGYMIRDLVLDKDGVTALCYFAQLAAELHSQGKRVKHLLDDLYDHYDYYVSSNSYFTCSDPKVIKRVFDGIRFGHRDSSVSYIQLYRKNDGLALKYPKTIGGFAVSYVQDLTVGVEFNVDELTTRFGDSNNNDGVLEFDGPELTPKFPISASSQMITFSTVNGGRMTLRTSGTEPKIKYYLEMGGRLDQSREEVHKDLEWLVEGIKTDLVDAKGNGLN